MVVPATRYMRAEGPPTARDPTRRPLGFLVPKKAFFEHDGFDRRLPGLVSRCSSIARVSHEQRTADNQEMTVTVGAFGSKGPSPRRSTEARSSCGSLASTRACVFVITKVSPKYPLPYPPYPLARGSIAPRGRLTFRYAAEYARSTPPVFGNVPR